MVIYQWHVVFVVSFRSGSSRRSKHSEVADDEGSIGDQQDSSNVAADWTGVVIVIINDLHQCRNGFEAIEALNLLDQCLQKSREF